MSNWRLSRRHFISSTGSVLLLPLLDSLWPRAARANGTPDPKRLVVMYMPDGTYNVPGDETWSPPNGPLAAGTIGEVLSPFTANIGDLTVLKYIKSKAANASFTKFPNYPVSLHQVAPSAYLTGQVLAGSSVDQAYIPGSSLDQMYAQVSGKPSLVLAGENNPFQLFSNPYGCTFMTISYNNSRQVEPILYPGQLYQSMFASLAPPAAPPPPSPALRNKSILDNAAVDLADLQSKLGKSDGARLDDYLTSVRALEMQLAALPPPPTPQCQPIAAPAASLDQTDTYGQLQNFTPKFQAFIDMIVLAFKCDMVRSVVLMYGGEESVRVLGNQIPSSLYHPQLSASQLQTIQGIQDHPYSHYEIAGLAKPAMVTRDRYRMSFMISLLNALKAGKDPSGAPILDNTVVHNGCGIPDGMHGNSSHGYFEHRPTVVAGGRNLGLHPGQSIDVGNNDMADLCFTYSKALGMNLGNFAGSTTTIPL